MVWETHLRNRTSALGNRERDFTRHASPRMVPSVGSESNRTEPQALTTMGLLSSLLGNASEIDIQQVQSDLAPVLIPGETVNRGFKIFRDLFVFTEHRLILVDVQGLTGSKVSYHSVLYRSITQFSVETAGSFDADAELKIWVSGGGEPISKEFKKGTDVVGIQKHLAGCIFGASLRNG